MRRVLFLGQKQFGEEAWERLRQEDGNGYQILAVCSNASAEAVWWQSNRIFETRGSIAFIDNSNRNEDLLEAAILRYGIDTILCVQHAWVLSSKILSAVSYDALNFHNAKLPEYRGYNAINHAILNGDRSFTCTAHWMVNKVDEGDIALEATFDITPTDTALSLYAKSHHAGLRLFCEVISHLGDLKKIPRRRVEGEGCFYPRRSIEPLREIKIPFSDESGIKARAFFFPPFEPAFFWFNRTKFYVLPADLIKIGFKASTATLREIIASVQNSFTYGLR